MGQLLWHSGAKEMKAHKLFRYTDAHTCTQWCTLSVMSVSVIVIIIIIKNGAHAQSR